jgi:hypothetical protein
MQVNEYFERDLYAQQRHYRVEITQTLSGRTVVSYDCPDCGTSLYNPLDEIGTLDRCPSCKVEFVVPGGKA